MKKILVLILVIIYAVLMYGESYVYKESDGKATRNRFLEVIKIDSNSFLATETGEKGASGIEMEYELDGNYSILKWKYSFEKEKTNITFKRVKNSIVTKGTFKGKIEEKEIKIDGDPWYENWGLGLKGFVLSKNNTTYFWTIDPSDLSRIGKFKAEKIKTETIEFNGNKKEALRVKIALDGILSMLFSFEYWFDINDGKLLFMKSSGNATLELMEYKE